MCAAHMCLEKKSKNLNLFPIRFEFPGEKKIKFKKILSEKKERSDLTDDLEIKMRIEPHLFISSTPEKISLIACLT